MATSPLLFSFCCLALGLFVGTRLYGIGTRLPKLMEHQWAMEAAALRSAPMPEVQEPVHLLKPLVTCDLCGKRQGLHSALPLIGALPSVCASCGQAVTLRRFITELASGMLAGAVAWQYGPTWATLGGMALAWAFVVLTLIDLDSHLLPDSITLPLLWLGLIFNLGATFADLHSAVIGAMVGYLVLWAIYWAYRGAFRQEGIGHGDFKLLAALGAWFGWQPLLIVVGVASIAGGITSMGQGLLARHGKEMAMPFGPFLAAGGIVVLLWGKALVGFYLKV